MNLLLRLRLRDRRSFSRLLIAFTVCLLLGGARSEQPNPEAACPSASDLRSDLESRKDRLLKLKSRLEEFMAGKVIGDMSLAALFSVDPADADEVTRKVEELRQQLLEGQSSAAAQDPLSACWMNDGSIGKTASELESLQQAVAGLRFRFLTLPSEQRSAVLHPQIEAASQAGSVKRLQHEFRSAVDERHEAEKLLLQAEQASLATEGGPTGDLVAEYAELARIRADLASWQLRWLTSQETRASFYRDAANRLSTIAGVLLRPEPIRDLEHGYQQAVLIWRALVDETPQLLSDRDAWALPPLPPYPTRLLQKTPETPAALRYVEGYDRAAHFRASLLTRIGSRFQENVDLHHRVLLQSGEIRSQLLNALLDRGDRMPFTISPDIAQDVQREFTIVPYRLGSACYLRWIEIQTRLHQGWQGIARLAADLALLLALLAIPWLIWLAAKALSRRLNHLRLRLVRQSRTRPGASPIAQAIRTFLPYSDWLVMLGAVYIAQLLLARTGASELALLLPYVRYYIYYRLFRQLMQCDFLWVARQIRADELWALRRHLDVAARVVGLSTLLVLCLLTSIENLTRRGLIYHFVTWVFVDLAVLMAMAFAYQWRGLISARVAQLLPGETGQRLARWCNSAWGFILAPPALLLLFSASLLRWISDWSSHFELTKRIATELFRHRIETAIEKTDPAVSTALPAEYRQCFEGVATPESLLESASPELGTIHGLVQNWTEEAGSLNSLAIIGDKGSGKTCLLDCLEKKSPPLLTLRAAVTEKLTGRAKTLQFFRELLGAESSDGDDIAWVMNSDRPKTLVLVDDAHNCFLSAQGGFEAFDALLELISRPTPNLFWCVTFNKNAWSYLARVYSRHHYFGAVVKLTPWSEQTIQDLILKRHARSGFRLSYDDIIQAAGSRDRSDHLTYIENRFFRLLQQQSRGNPRLAIYLWLSTLRLVGSDSLRVGLPDEPDTTILADLPEDSLFVLAGIARHENLTLPQTVKVSQLQEGVARHVLDVGVRMHLLDCPDGCVYRLAVLYQYPLILHLQAKRFLYE